MTHKCIQTKGYKLTPNSLIGESGDIDETSYWEGKTMEEAFKNNIYECDFFVCEDKDCDFGTEDGDDAKEHEDDYA